MHPAVLPSTWADHSAAGNPPHEASFNPAPCTHGGAGHLSPSRHADTLISRCAGLQSRKRASTQA